MRSDDSLLKQENKFEPNQKAWKIIIQDLKTNKEQIIIANYVSIASGHHGTPETVKFPGQETFTGID